MVKGNEYFLLGSVTKFVPNVSAGGDGNNGEVV
jgi:curli biogenesis system outer membrane secretion channel CsgG